jgi:hypothetical protein
MGTRVKIIILSVVSSFIIGLVDSLFFLAVDEPLKELLQKNSFFKDNVSAGLCSNSISVSLAMLFGVFISNEIKKSYKLIENHYFHIIGIMSSTLLIIIIYNLIKK